MNLQHEVYNLRRFAAETEDKKIEGRTIRNEIHTLVSKI